ncbi:hypothetical protein HU200_062939 [Digitaria exilis]|uniref:Berberine/berberine-like domain-containing protein n=1 Tax=Digitaria exilis TaxID=1010633 RepID=A0A835A4F3_9POAL|nr:hypothetical protein HU200_062939 [Digitaria exilis]
MHSVVGDIPVDSEASKPLVTRTHNTPTGYRITPDSQGSLKWKAAIDVDRRPRLFHVHSVRERPPGPPHIVASYSGPPSAAHARARATTTKPHSLTHSSQLATKMAAASARALPLICILLCFLSPTPSSATAADFLRCLSTSVPSHLLFTQGRNFRCYSLYLGTCDQLVPLMSSRFPELGMTRGGCREMTWLQSTLYINSGTTNQPLETLLNRTTTSLRTFTKNKSDYVRQDITGDSWQKIFSWFNGPNAGLMILEPHGGQVGRVVDGDTPYPHRSGVLYNVQHIAFWSGDGGTAATAWINSFYNFMGQYVTKNPRTAYVNYRDLDIGQNAVAGGGVTSYNSGRVWGEKYFGAANFKRLAITKGKADPGDYFRNEQSVPPLVPRK